MNAAIAISLAVFFLIGVPIAVAIGLAAIVGIEAHGSLPLLLVAQRMFAGIDSFPLMAIPLFILAGNLMSAGGISRRLVDLAKALVGGMQGGLACSCVLTCMMFASVSGSSVATTFAIGAILIPAMARHGYPKPLAASVQASSAELGVLIPPSIPLILYGVSTNTSIEQLFIAGIGPGLLVAGALMLTVILICRSRGLGLEDGKDRPSLRAATIAALPAMLVPFVIIGGIYSGVFTPTEASAAAVATAILVSLVFYRELPLRALPNILKRTVVSSTAIMLIISAAALFSFLITRSGLPNDIAVWFNAVFETRFAFLLVVNLLLLLVGMFIETSAAILVLAPILAPIAIAYGVDPVHFGLIVVVNLALGMITPPLGVNLFAACAVAGIPVERIIPQLIWFVLVVFVCLMLITYVPMIALGPVELLVER
ncbi:TRAP transporter large permease subunit [Roseobacter sp. HKCCD9010]|uniref:TRAP transporter large permease n=1 Tax=unclassified Roseobacter TaxID=196798 RepID=UPI001491051E|nr:MULTISPECIES: TRAP transporter large permease [unclassified Roseobacter]MBF9052092.1 TRAP transporter large permease subunit [Rhodobacterales bacterium HKCCD4356]NNV14014.1 TRAP transporter large permease subunit [Roseobacter sp. HKCCD7357]NNV18255.1 TRAP transporter large permease subunit [Roseobacter sp. HKCCD8768]NNV27713.1 TRAP transporter large permease subunit [Roseobacter sp. HKCCD8192]NNV31956.1 TRAP transporter large permease subunit [Roseobacter sp. HKCCD9061]